MEQNFPILEFDQDTAAMLEPTNIIKENVAMLAMILAEIFWTQENGTENGKSEKNF